jgi:hypothetical protein
VEASGSAESDEWSVGGSGGKEPCSISGHGVVSLLLFLPDYIIASQPTGPHLFSLFGRLFLSISIPTSVAARLSSLV